MTATPAAPIHTNRVSIEQIVAAFRQAGWKNISNTEASAQASCPANGIGLTVTARTDVNFLNLYSWVGDPDHELIAFAGDCTKRIPHDLLVLGKTLEYIGKLRFTKRTK